MWSSDWFFRRETYVDHVKRIYDLFIPHMIEFEHDVTNEIVLDMSGFSTPVSEPNPKPTSSDYPTQKYIPYHHHHHKN